MNHTSHLGSIELIIAVVLFVLVMLAMKVLRSVAKIVLKDMIWILLWRHFSGAHYSGKEHTDAGWFSRGSTVYRKNGRATAWEHAPRSHRALWRVGCTFAFLAAIYGLFADRSVTVHAIEALIVYGLVVLGFIIEARWRERLHRRHHLNPIVKSLAHYLRRSDHDMRKRVHIRAENLHQDQGEIGYVELPEEFSPADDAKTSVERIINDHLPVDIEIEWQLAQSPKLAVVMAARKPPSLVPWEEMLAAMLACEIGRVILGKDRFKSPYGSSFTDLDDPHWGLSVNTGRGKSNFLAIVCAQILHQDPQAQVIAIDPKRTSLVDYLGSPVSGAGLKLLIPGVTMANNPNDPESMRQAVARARKILENRSAIAERDRQAKFPICLLVIDELNMFRDIMFTDWARQRAEDPTLPKDDPLWDDIRAVLRTGRFVSVHCVAVSQDFRDDAIGGKGARNYFGFRGLAGFRPNQWKMFVGTTPVPVSQKGVGRWVFTDGEEETWVQITCADPEQVYEYASWDRELYDESASVSRPPLPVLFFKTSDEETDGQAELSAGSRRMIVGLKEAASHLGMREAAFAKARQRAQSDGGTGIPGEFRMARQPCWYEDDLDEWARNRPKSRGQ